MNKIIVSILFAVILVLGINKIADVIFFVEKPEKSAYQVAVSTNGQTSETTKSDSGEKEDLNITTLLASANAADGEKVFKKCAACHSIAKGGANKIGPALWGVMGRKVASVSDYNYSKALKEYGKIWSLEEMDGFLTKPKNWIKGTKMSFAGLKSEKDRAAVILFMNKNTDNPVPLQ